MAKRKLRITPQGYLVFAAAAVLIISIIIIIVATSCESCKGETTPADVNASTSPSIAPVNTMSPPASIEASTLPSTSASTNTPEATDPPSTVPSSSATTPVTPDPNALSEPTDAMKKAAVSGKLIKDDVNMRQGPSTNHLLVAEGLKINSVLTVYTEENGWYFLKVNALNKYGYIRKDMVKLDKALGSTDDVEVPSGALEGKISASKLVLRSAPNLTDDKNKLGDYSKDQVLFIFYKETDSAGNLFYYVQIPGTDTKGYLCARKAGETAYMVSCSGTVPDKP